MQKQASESINKLDKQKNETEEKVVDLPRKESFELEEKNQERMTVGAIEANSLSTISTSSDDEIILHPLLPKLSESIETVIENSSSEDEPLINYSSLIPQDQQSQQNQQSQQSQQSQQNQQNQTLQDNSSEDEPILASFNPHNSISSFQDSSEDEKIGDLMRKNDDESTTSDSDVPISHQVAELSGSSIPVPQEIVSHDFTNTSSSNSSLLIPILHSTLESSVHSGSDPLVQQESTGMKPPPLTHEVINQLFPRSHVSQCSVLPKSQRVTTQSSVICPLCLSLCDNPENLRQHLNKSCAMLPKQSEITGDHDILHQDCKKVQIQSPLQQKPISTQLEALEIGSIDIPAPVESLSKANELKSTEPPLSPHNSFLQSKELPKATPLANSIVNESDLGLNSEDLDLLMKLELDDIPSNSEAGPASKPLSNSVCSICRDGSSEENNPLLCCQRCGVIVHASCYGLSTPPSSSWQCDVFCSAFSSFVELFCWFSLCCVWSLWSRRRRYEVEC